MTEKIYNACVFLDLISISCPGVWLCPKGKVFVKICIFGVADLSKEVDPFFPLVFRERFNFQKVFKNLTGIHELYDRIGRSVISMDLIQCPVGSSGCVHLAAFNALMSDILHPYSTCFSKPQNTSGIELLFTATKSFPGIIAPKADISTKVVVSDMFEDKFGASSQKNQSKRILDPSKRRQQPVCHTKDNLNCKCFHSHQYLNMPERSENKFGPEESGRNSRRPLEGNQNKFREYRHLTPPTCHDDGRKDLIGDQSFQTPSDSSLEQRSIDNMNGRQERLEQNFDPFTDQITVRGLDNRTLMKEDIIDRDEHRTLYDGDNSRLKQSFHETSLEDEYLKNRNYKPVDEEEEEEANSVDIPEVANLRAPDEISPNRYQANTSYDSRSRKYDTGKNKKAFGTEGYCTCMHLRSSAGRSRRSKGNFSKPQSNMKGNARNYPSDRNKRRTQQYKRETNMIYVDEKQGQITSRATSPYKVPFENSSERQGIGDSFLQYREASPNCCSKFKEPYSNQLPLQSHQQLRKKGVEKSHKKTTMNELDTSKLNRDRNSKRSSKGHRPTGRSYRDEPVDRSHIEEAVNGHIDTENSTRYAYARQKKKESIRCKYFPTRNEYPQNKKDNLLTKHELTDKLPIDQPVEYQTDGKYDNTDDNEGDEISEEEGCKCQLCNHYQKLYNPKVHPCPRFKKDEFSNNSRVGRFATARKKMISSRMMMPSRNNRLTIGKNFRCPELRNPFNSTS